MLKRTKGRFLLTLLVITGLAGTLKNSTLTKQERKIAVTELKDTRVELFKAVKDLSDQQLNYKAGPDRWSIKECIFHIALAEKSLGTMLDAAMKEPAAPEKRSEVKLADEAILKMVTDRSNKLQAPETLRPDKAGWTTVPEALSDFKAGRNDRIKYAKSTTEDLRNHFFQLPLGWIDAYQFMLFMSAHSNRHTQQINEIKADPGFPKQ